jgi:hypothetical protein
VKPVWHVIASDDLIAMLERAKAGEEPQMIYLEEYANSQHEHVEGEDA